MNTVPAGCGWNWVRTGFALFRKNPAMWAFLVFSYLMLTQILGMIPILGLFFALVLVPSFSAGFMTFSRELDQGKRIGFALLFSGFRSSLPALLWQGGLYLPCVLIILGLSALADGGALLKMVVWGELPLEAISGDSGFLAAVALFGMLYIPVSAAFWFAPALSAWRNLPALQAVFYSFFAAVRNWRAFLAYGIAISLLGFTFTIVGIVLAVLLQGLLGNNSQSAIVLVKLLVMLTYVSILLASFYASYRDIFPPPVAAAKPEAVTDADAQ